MASTAQTRPPTVLQIVPRLVIGGVERGTVDMAAALTAAGWRAIVASEGGPMVREIERAGGVHVELPLASKNPLVMRANIGRLVELIERQTVDIVHARSRAPAWSAVSAAQRTGAHFITTFHNVYGGEGWLKRRYNGVMAEGERVIAISHFVAEHAARVYGVAPQRLRVIHRGVDVGRFDPDRVTAERVVYLARQWQLPDGAPVVMLPGRLTRWKGHIVLMEAIARLKRPDIQCLIVGSGGEKYRQELVDAALRLGLAGSCRIIEDCRDMPAAYQLADIVVSASTEPEGFGRVIVEAQAMGRPVIATDHGGARESVIDGETGWLVPPGDAASLSDAIAMLLHRSQNQRVAHGARAIDHVRAHFTTAHMTERTLDVYSEVLFPPEEVALPAMSGSAAA